MNLKTSNTSVKVKLFESPGKAGGLPILKYYWQIFQGDFKIRRSSDKPFTYKYTFECTGVPPEKAQTSFKLPKLTEEKVDELATIMNPSIRGIKNYLYRQDSIEQKMKLTDRIYGGLIGP